MHVGYNSHRTIVGESRSGIKKTIRTIHHPRHPPKMGTPLSMITTDNTLVTELCRSQFRVNMCTRVFYGRTYLFKSLVYRIIL